MHIQCESYLCLWDNTTPGARSVQRTHQTFGKMFALFVLLNDCSQRTFAEWKETAIWSVCYSEQRWRRPQGLFQKAQVLYIAQTMHAMVDKGRI